jgi:nucleoside-diphosphate-sugar epimerase
MKKSKKILIIGGLGFIGKNLYLELQKRDFRADIFSINRLSVNDPFYSHFTGELIHGDICKPEDIRAVVKDYDVIFSLAGISGAASSNYCPIRDLEINLRGHLNILEACREVNPQARLIFPSSRLVYGKPHHIPVDEKHPLNPESVYAANKLTAENYYLIYHKLFNLDVIILRISNPYGPYYEITTSNYGIINLFIIKALKGEKIEIFGDGHQQRDYLFINDLGSLLSGFVSAQGLSGEIFNIGYGEGISLFNSIQVIKRFIPELSFVTIPWPEDYEKIETGDYITDITKIKKYTGWEPQTVFEEGIGKTIDYYRRYLHA